MHRRPPSESLRATDAEREQTVRTLHLAAVHGCLSPVELEQRVDAAWTAVTRADLPPLVADLPPLPGRTDLPPPPPPPPWTGRGRSWWLWALVPWMHGIGWIYAAALTKAWRYWFLAAVYSVPMPLPALISDDTGELPNWAMAVVTSLWMINIVHALVARDDVNARLSARFSTGP